MNPDTGHLVALDDGELPERGYQRLPDELAAEAEKALGGQRETYVDLEASSPMSEWAADQRRRKVKKKARARAKRKALKRARRH